MVLRAIVCSIVHDCNGCGERTRKRIRKIHLYIKKKIMTYRWLPSRRWNGNPRCCRLGFVFGCQLPAGANTSKCRTLTHTHTHRRRRSSTAREITFSSNLRIYWSHSPISCQTSNESFEWLHVLWTPLLCERRIIYNSHSSLCQQAIMDDFYCLYIAPCPSPRSLNARVNAVKTGNAFSS